MYPSDKSHLSCSWCVRSFKQMHHDPALFLWLTCGKSYVNQWQINPLNCRDNSYVVMKLQFNSRSLQGEKELPASVNFCLFLCSWAFFNSLKCFDIPLIDKMRYKIPVVLYAYNIEGFSVTLWKIRLLYIPLTFSFAHNVMVVCPQRQGQVWSIINNKCFLLNSFIS